MPSFPSSAFLRLFLLICLFSGQPCFSLEASEPAVAESRASRYADLILADRPAAYWRFDSGQAPTVPNASDQSGLEARVAGKVSLETPGPRSPRFPGFGRDNRAARFSGNGSFLRVADADENRSLEFDKDDAITLEAWVNPVRVGEDQQIYIVGKGRTNNKGFAKDNQNYALPSAGRRRHGPVEFSVPQCKKPQRRAG